MRMKIVRPKLTFTDESLPLILEALKDSMGFEIKEGHIIYKGEKIMNGNILGFHKELGIITK